jgi:putative addiction module antidote
MLELKIRKFGNSLGVILPKEVIERLRTGEGEHVLLVEAPGDVYQLTKPGEELQQQLKIAREGMTRYRKALRVLAK